VESTKTVVCKLNTSKEEFEKLYNTIIAFRDACNYISEIAWDNRVFNPVALYHFTYKDVRTKFQLPANLAIRARDRVAKSYKTERKKQHKFRQLSMDLDARLFRLLRNCNRVSISTIEGRVKPKIAIGEYQRELLKNPVRDAKLVLSHKEFYLHITIRYKVPEPEGTNPVGVDIGMKQLLVASNGFRVKGNNIKHRRQHFKELRRSLQKKGTSSAKRKLKQLSGRERQYANTVLHQVSREFVNSLKKGDYVVMEKLNGIRESSIRKKQRFEFHSWAFYILQQMVSYKCADRGIPVVFVEPASKRCPRCGTIDRANRRTQSLFKCTRCGFQHNADIVAACNLREQARRY